MFAFILNIVIIAIVMKIFFRFMYPKPPKHFFPQAGDDVTLRHCDYCGHELATYRGILEECSEQEVEAQKRYYFFCNEEHQRAFFEGRVYRVDHDDGLPIKKSE